MPGMHELTHTLQAHAGTHLDSYLVRLLHECGAVLNTQAERQTVREIKEQLCHVAPYGRFETECKRFYGQERRHVALAPHVAML